jgi:hypothetical protein
MFDQLLRSFSRLKITLRRAPVSRDLPGLERDRSLAERLAAAPAP